MEEAELIIVLMSSDDDDANENSNAITSTASSSSSSSSSSSLSLSNTEDDSSNGKCSMKSVIKVLGSIHARVRTPTAFNLVCKEVWDKLGCMDKMRYKKRVEQMMEESQPENYNIEFSDSMSCISSNWHNAALVRDQVFAKTGYLLAGKEKWASLQAEEREQYKRKAKVLRKMDSEAYPPNGFSQCLRTITLPGCYNDMLLLRREVECEVSTCWRRLMKSIHT